MAKTLTIMMKKLPKIIAEILKMMMKKVTKKHMNTMTFESKCSNFKDFLLLSEKFI